jgi:hypothetical protein
MASLTGNPIQNSYSGLIKTENNNAFSGVVTQRLTDGEGNILPVTIGTDLIQITSDSITLVNAANEGMGITGTQTLFNGNVDFSLATVTGLPSSGGTTAFNLPAFTIAAGAPAADTVYAVTTIPANTFTIGDVLEFRSMEQRADLNNIIYESYLFSDTAQTVGQTTVAGTNVQQAGLQDSLNGKLYYQKTLYIGATGTAVWNYGRPNESFESGTVGGDPIEIQAIDWTVDQYFYFQAWNDNTTGTIQNYGTVLRKLN